MSLQNKYYTEGLPIGTVTVDIDGTARVNTRTGGALSQDAWGRPKAIQDRSLIHGYFSNGIPSATWKETFNGVERALTNCTSVDGLALINSGATSGDETIMDTFRSPRYEPNRGHNWAISALLPGPTLLGERDMGMFTEENGLFFRLKSDGLLYACRTRTFNGGPTTTTFEELIDADKLPVGFDVTKGNIYDIQAQLRGVGNVKFFIGDPVTGVSICVHTMALLGTLDNLSISNFSLPIAFRSKNLGQAVEIQAGCVDLSSEGGQDIDHTYGSISMLTTSGQVALPATFNTPVLVVRNKSTKGGLRNMRDIQALAISAYSNQRAFLRVWATRDNTAITLGTQTWTDYGDGFSEFIQYSPSGTPMTFNTAKATLMFGARVDQDTTFSSPAMFEGKTEIHLSPGDTFVFTLHRENGLAHDGGVTFEFGEEI